LDLKNLRIRKTTHLYIAVLTIRSK